MKLKALLLIILFVSFTSPAFADVTDRLAVMAIMGEASNQGYEGMVAVGEAIRNRGNLKGVYGVNARHIHKEPKWVWDMALRAWKDSERSNLVKGADHWENIKAYGKPYWAKKMIETARIKDHVFYKSVNRRV